MEIRIIALVLVAILAYWTGRQSVVQSNEYTTNKRTVEWYNATYLRKQGGTSFAGGRNYDLRSFDGGKIWYDVTRTEDGRVIINGPADPGLLAHLAGLDNLTEHVLSNGPIQLGAGNQRDIELLRGAGFTVAETAK